MSALPRCQRCRPRVRSPSHCAALSCAAPLPLYPALLRARYPGRVASDQRPIYGEDKRALLRGADFYLVGRGPWWGFLGFLEAPPGP